MSKQETKLSDGWQKWKKMSGSAQHTTNDLPSIDPLTEAVTAAEPVVPNGDVNDNTIAKHQQETVSWSNFLNPLSYITDTFHAANLFTPQLSNDSQSILSASSTSQSTTIPWLSWLLPAPKHIDESDIPRSLLVTEIELRKNVKEAKKALQNNETVWAWHQKNYHSPNSRGELSVLGTKSETTPVELSKYPSLNHGESNSVQKDDALINFQSGVLVPRFNENNRVITNKTKVRIAAELYYNIPTEKHLYIKRNPAKLFIENHLIISVTGACSKSSSKSSNGSSSQLNSQHVIQIASESLDLWYKQNDLPLNHNIETIAITVGKQSSDSLEDLFKLLINWREHFKNIHHLWIIGYKDCVPLSLALLDILISRNLFDNGKKIGFLSLDGIIPSSYSDSTLLDSNASISPASETAINSNNIWNSKEFERNLNRLINESNIKITFIGTLNDVSNTLALNFQHPNIFRSIYLFKSHYNDSFEKHLFKLLLTSLNLGHDSTRLLLQISKYFNVQGNSAPINISEDLKKDILIDTLNHSLKTTSLYHQKPLLNKIINDPILSNDFNLIWTLHGFMSDFKEMKNINAIEDLRKLISLYKEWDPQSKSLKDLRYMLEVLGISEYSATINKL